MPSGDASRLPRQAGPGRPKGSKDKVPRSLKASFRIVYEKICKENPDLLRKAIEAGLRGKPKEAFPFVQLGAFYLDGKPTETHEHHIPEPVTVHHRCVGPTK